MHVSYLILAVVVLGPTIYIPFEHALLYDIRRWSSLYRLDDTGFCETQANESAIRYVHWLYVWESYIVAAASRVSSPICMMSLEETQPQSESNPPLGSLAIE